jgi:hypothetical protein
MDDDRARARRSSRVATQATIDASHHAIERARELRDEAMRAIEASQKVRERVRQQTGDLPPR